MRDPFKELWAQVDRDRKEKIEKGVSEMIEDPEGRGLLIVENQYGTILSAELSREVPTGMIILTREVLNLDRLIPTPTEGG